MDFFFSDLRSAAMAEKIRCAIYTRKSTEEGLDQDFNSLEAQRESAEAYIRSQRQLGWTLVAKRYDDGGFTGSNLERPALKRLLEDVEAQRIQCVVVYKVDRLSRSLLDFARLIDRFDQRSVSFVSVTQQFNTTNSLGRLTLNILLSFAQFEREIIGERTRDKMCAARRRGKWTGGLPVLGYDVDSSGGRLVVNEGEAARVREIFELYDTYRSVSALQVELKRRAWTMKSWTTKAGKMRKGGVFNKATLLRLLTNAVYSGKIEHKRVFYAGEHPPIIESTVWKRVNDELREKRRIVKYQSSIPRVALLKGLLYCGNCNLPMKPTYTSKGERRFRYYVCRTVKIEGRCPTKSIAARAIEGSVVEQVRLALSAEKAREELNVSGNEWQAFEQNHSEEFIRSIVRRVAYEGVAGAVSLELGR
jgi:site-specific DNA recombinase